jgi:hypothetical protein
VTARLREHAAAPVAAGGRPVADCGKRPRRRRLPGSEVTIQPDHASAHEQIIAVLYGQGLQSWPPDAELICQQLLGAASGQRWIRSVRKAGCRLLSGTWWQNSSA